MKRLPGIYSVHPDSTVLDALRVMTEANCGAVLALNDDQKLVGILSERDYARKVVLSGRSSMNTQVKDIMTHDVITAHPNDTATTCMNTVLQKRIRHLPIVDESGEILGVLSIGDLLREVVEHQAELIDQMTNFIEHAR